MRDSLPDEILSYANVLFDESSNQKNYDISYEEFIGYFSEKRELTNRDVIIGASFTYSWMPKILAIDGSYVEKARIVLNNAKVGNLLSVEDYDVLVSTINNSMVGASKLLHFVRPDIYPIWDSRVWRFLSGPEKGRRKPYDYEIKNVKTYLRFKELCENIIHSEKFLLIHENFSSIKSYDISYLRTVELIMFLSYETPLNSDWMTD